MTSEQKVDRLERMVRLLYEATLRDSREARKQTAKWESYFAADREYESAKLAAAKNPKDSDTSQTLRRAAESLGRRAKNSGSGSKTGKSLSTRNFIWFAKYLCGSITFLAKSADRVRGDSVRQLSDLRRHARESICAQVEGSQVQFENFLIGNWEPFFVKFRRILR